VVLDRSAYDGVRVGAFSLRVSSTSGTDG